MRKVNCRGLILLLFAILTMISSLSFGDIIISDAPGWQLGPRIVWNGERYLVVWEDGRDPGKWDIYAQFVDSLGNLIDANFVFIPTSPCTNKTCYDICASDSNYFVLFGPNSPRSKLYGAIVSFEGTVIDTPFLIGTGTLSVVDGEHAEVGWNGEKYLVGWNKDYQTIACKFFSRDGVPLGDTFCVNFPTDTLFLSSIASDNKDFLMVFSYSLHCLSPTCGIIMPSTGPPLDTLFFIPGSWGDWRAASSDGENYLVGWDYGNSGLGPTYAQRVSSNGNLIESSFAVSDSQHIGLGNVSSNGLNYLVVLFTGLCLPRHIVGQFVSSKGGLIGTNFLVTSTELTDFSYGLTCDGNTNNYLVVWGHYLGFPPDETDIYGTLIPSVGIEESKTLFPLRVSQNSPNPFYLRTEIKFNVRKSSNVSFSVFNLAGELIEERNLGYKLPGFYTLSFSADSFKEKLSQGVYFYSFKINNCVITKKMVLLH